MQHHFNYYAHLSKGWVLQMQEKGMQPEPAQPLQISPSCLWITICKVNLVDFKVAVDDNEFSSPFYSEVGLKWQDMQQT